MNDNCTSTEKPVYFVAHVYYQKLCYIKTNYIVNNNHEDSHVIKMLH